MRSGWGGFLVSLDKQSHFVKNYLRALYSPKTLAHRSCQAKAEARTPNGVNIRQKLTPNKRKSVESNCISIRNACIFFIIIRI